MTLAAKPARRQRRKGAAAISSPRPTDLLAWYDRHRRKLPWRAPPGERADPYRVWLSEIMLQQTTVKAVGPYYARFLARWPDIGRWRRRRSTTCSRPGPGSAITPAPAICTLAPASWSSGMAVKFRQAKSALRDLPGIGAYTAAAIAAIAFDAPATPVDGNIERVIARLYAVDTPLPAAKPEISRLARGLTPPRRAGDFAQAMMDLGATICTPKTPACALCPWNESCAAYARGDAETFPRRVPKREGALRRGAAFVVRRADGFVLVRTRPEKGLLGGMTEVPTTEWTKDFDESVALESVAAFCFAKVAELGVAPLGIVRHVFTHFPLELTVYAADVPARTPAPKGTRWIAIAELAGEALPSLMRKVLAHALTSDRIHKVQPGKDQS